MLCFQKHMMITSAILFLILGGSQPVLGVLLQNLCLKSRPMFIKKFVRGHMVFKTKGELLKSTSDSLILMNQVYWSMTSIAKLLQRQALSWDLMSFEHYLINMIRINQAKWIMTNLRHFYLLSRQASRFIFLLRWRWLKSHQLMYLLKLDKSYWKEELMESEDLA